MSNKLITINLVVLNGEKYIRRCLESIKNQTYPHGQVEFNVFDNGSTDSTKNIIREMAGEFSDFLKFNFIESDKNLGMWPGQEKLLKDSSGKHIVVMAVDVILDENFLQKAVEIMNGDEKIGALQPKIYNYDVGRLENNGLEKKVIDTCGFKIFKSRRIINIGHGEKDNGQFNEEKEIFAVEGAVPVFRKDALESCQVAGEIIDHDYFWYGDDLDIAWRMRVFGWKQLFAPHVIAWHDRQTTKNTQKGFADFIKIRRQLPIQKRGLDWRNVHWTIVKNDYTINILKDLPYILKREIMMLGYIIIFEPKVLGEIVNFLRLLPKMLRKRKLIMKRRSASPEEMRKWFT